MDLGRYFKITEKLLLTTGDGDWQIEFVVPQEIGTALLMDKAFEPMMRQNKQ